MYSGVIGREYCGYGANPKNKIDVYVLDEIKSRTVILRKEVKHNGFKAITYIHIHKIKFQNWIDCKHQMYVRQVGEVTLPFPDENC